MDTLDALDGSDAWFDWVAEVALADVTGGKELIAPSCRKAKLSGANLGFDIDEGRGGGLILLN